MKYLKLFEEMCSTKIVEQVNDILVNFMDEYKVSVEHNKIRTGTEFVSIDIYNVGDDDEVDYRYGNSDLPLVVLDEEKAEDLIRLHMFFNKNGWRYSGGGADLYNGAEILIRVDKNEQLVDQSGRGWKDWKELSILSMTFRY